MSDGESAGGGHQGSSPVPPAVPDHRSSKITTKHDLSLFNTIPTSISDNTTTRNITTVSNNQQISESLSTSKSLASTTAVAFTSKAKSLQQQQQLHLQRSTLSLPSHQLHMSQTTPTTISSSLATTIGNTSKAQVQQQQQQYFNKTTLLQSTASSSLPLNSSSTTSSVTTFHSKKSENIPERIIVGGSCSSSATTSIVDKQIVASSSSLLPKTIGGFPNIVVAGDSSKAVSVRIAAVSTTTPKDFKKLKERIFEHKTQRLRILKEKHTENVAELYYLENGGNMMEYQAWRKKPPTAQLNAFTSINNYKLHTQSQQQLTQHAGEKNAVSTAATLLQQQQLQKKHTNENIATIIGVANNPSGLEGITPVATIQARKQTSNTLSETSSRLTVAATNKISNSQSQGSIAATSTVVATTTITSTTPVATLNKHNATVPTPTTNVGNDDGISSGGGFDVPPQGAEIKIPAVGATPVAVSTKLPAAVVQQLSQQGHIPGRPLGGRHGMVFGQIHSPSASFGNSLLPLIPGGTPLLPCSIDNGATALRRNGNGISSTTSGPHDAVASTSATSGISGGGTDSMAESVHTIQLYSGGRTSSGLLVSAGVATNTNGGGQLGGSNSGNGSSSDIAAAASSSSAATTSALLGCGNTQEFSYKAKQEVYVMQRISELQREGLWTEKRLPKLQEPIRSKAHWDYVLEEMVWMAADFAQERKWKMMAAKKCAKMVHKYFQDKANAAQKAERAQELQRKRIAAFISKEVKLFWSNVEKLVEYKHHTKLEEKRKKALDQHLSFIVDQTEKFSQQLVEGMNKSFVDATSGAASLNSSRISSPKGSGDVANNVSDDEFRPETVSEDDEETIAKAEAEETVDVTAEIVALEKESQMDFDDFLNNLPKGYLEHRHKIPLDIDVGNSTRSKKTSAVAGEVSDDIDDVEFVVNNSSSEDDDENTISKQEEDEMDIDHQKEVDELKADNDLTVEELLLKYKAGEIDDDATIAETANKLENRSSGGDVDKEDDDSDGVDEDSSSVNDFDGARDSDDCSTNYDETVENSVNETSDEEITVTSESEADDDDEEEPDDGLAKLLQETDANSKDDMIKDVAALAESIQPKGNTLSSTNVVTPVPFLLRQTLREYQHIGLDWLVTMYERKLNGILADEMGLGKTIQTIALLAHLACEKSNWGPHLIVVPSSVMLNWEIEFKKWCPAFKILTYYGTQKERKLKRVGWTKPNAFHVCITSYNLVVQDQQSFRRKKWKYLILDEAQNIKNFKSQRWQLLLNFATERRLLLTGTPLQNDLMELWSLMHFLMPSVFSSHREFKEWFSNPMTGMIEGNVEYNETLISRLHKVIRPFLLRRLKKEVEKQMPKKYEHVVMCRLSNRQRYLYDDFMSRAKTKETLQTGNLLSVINVLMQLRKVCNHPNMFEVRPTQSPFHMDGIEYQAPRLVCDLIEYDPFSQIDLNALNLLLLHIECNITAYVSYKSRLLAAPRKLIEEIDTLPETPPPCPVGLFKFHIRVRDANVQQSLSLYSSRNTNKNGVCVGASPSMRADGNKLVLVRKVGGSNRRYFSRVNNNNINTSVIRTRCNDGDAEDSTCENGATLAKVARISSMRSIFDGARKTTIGSMISSAATVPKFSDELQVKSEVVNTDLVNTLAHEVKNALVQSIKVEQQSDESVKMGVTAADELSNGAKMPRTIKTEYDVEIIEADSGCGGATSASSGGKRLNAMLPNRNEIVKSRKEKRMERLKLMASVNKRRLEAAPIYGQDCREALERLMTPTQLRDYSSWQTRSYSNCRVATMSGNNEWTLSDMIVAHERRCTMLQQVFANFVTYVPSVCAPRARYYIQHLHTARAKYEVEIEKTLTMAMSPKLALLHPIASAMTTQFPDPRLIQYDCGKLQTLDRLLRQLKCEQHRVLIFTQMTRMLDVLEAFLNYHGYIYLRLDGSTRVEQRQMLMERFNADKRIFCFILSTRSGGVGINLTGADTVIFYDSDWNPTMDAQAQDRCHRIGQTRDVHIYRLVCENTIEVNILKKANQKRMLSDMAIEGGNFTASYFKSSTIKDLFNMDATATPANETDNGDSSNVASKVVGTAPSATSTVDAGRENDESDKQSLRVFENALAVAEDEQDVQATKTAKAEAAADLAVFDETIPIDEASTDPAAAVMAGGNNINRNDMELSKADLEMMNIVKQLSPIERYAMRFVEETGAAWTAAQLRAAEEEIEAQKREWEANRLAALQKEEQILKEAEQEENNSMLLTYSRKDATNQIWICDNVSELMPMWCPPTPPQDDSDIYIDYSLGFMYETTPIPEPELPPVYVKRDYNKRSRVDAGLVGDGNRRSLKIRREDTAVCPPRSLFDRPSVAVARLRRELKNQRYRGVFKPNAQISLTPKGSQMQPSQTIASSAVVMQATAAAATTKVLTEPEGMLEWCIFEDIAILHVLVNLQGLPCSLMLLSPGHTPNWDLVAEIVNYMSKTHRTPKQCRWRYEAVIQQREEGKLVESPKKQKKIKTAMKTEYLKGPLRYLRTTQMYAVDNNASYMKMMRSRFDCIKAAYLKKAPPPKRHFNTPSVMNAKHMEVLTDFGIVNYDQPLNPMSIAAQRANKLREKQRSQTAPPAMPMVGAQAQMGVTVQQQQQTVFAQRQQLHEIAHQHQQQQQQQQIQQQSHVQSISAAVGAPLHGHAMQIQHIGTNAAQQQQATAAIVLQHASTLAQQQQQQQHQQQQMPNSASAQLLRTAAGGTVGGGGSIVKAIVAPQPTATSILTANQVQQHLAQQQSSGGVGSAMVQVQQNMVGGGSSPAAVSMVLTTPVQTISPSVQAATVVAQSHHHVAVGSGTQMVSIAAPQTIVSGASPVGSIVQTQSLSQVVSVPQLAAVGTVLTTSATAVSAGLQHHHVGAVGSGNALGALNSSALRAQRIVTTGTGTLQDVVLQQRGSGNSSSTILSMSSLGQSASPAAHFPAAQLRLTSMTGGAKIPVSTLQQSGKLGATTSSPVSGVGAQAAPLQLYRQRQQLKVLQASTAQASGGTGSSTPQTVVQTAGGGTTLVSAGGTIIQGNLMQPNSSAAAGGIVATTTTALQMCGGQKVALATVAGAQPTVTTVHMPSSQGRTQFIKQVNSAAGGSKQTIARQVAAVGDSADMLLVKRQVINNSGGGGGIQKTQLLQQGQIFTATNTGGGIQLQQQQLATTASVQQHLTQQAVQTSQQQVLSTQVTPQQITTLVKTSSPAAAALGAGNITTTGGGGTIVTASGGNSGQSLSGGMTLPQLKAGGQIKVTMANQSQIRQLHMQQHLTTRKIGRMAQIAAATACGTQQGNVTVVTTGAVPSTSGGAPTAGGVTVQQTPSTAQTAVGISGNGTVATAPAAKVPTNSGVQTQLVHIQNTKSLSNSVTVQQLQQVIRQGQPGTLGGLVLNKSGMGRVIPVSMATAHSNQQRQTIQVVSSAQALAAATGSSIRTHVTGGQGIAGTIKVATGGGSVAAGSIGAGQGQSQTQQALITAMQAVNAAQQQQSQRQNASPVRLQTTASGSLVAVVQQQQQQLHQPQQQQHQNVNTNSIVGGSIVMTQSGGGGGVGSNSNIVGSSNTNASSGAPATTEMMTMTTQGAAIATNVQLQQQQQPRQQMRTLVKKKLMNQQQQQQQSSNTQ